MKLMPLPHDHNRHNHHQASHSSSRSRSRSASLSRPATPCTPLPSQVGGHDGVLTSADESLVFKPTLPLERTFYELLHQNHHIQHQREGGVGGSASALAALRPFVPKYYGTLKLEGALQTLSASSAKAAATTGTAPAAGIQVIPITALDQDKDESSDPRNKERRPSSASSPLSYQSHLFPSRGYPQVIVLENVSHQFKKPCVADIKLGTVLFDESANAEKRERMLAAAAHTTSLATGIRLTGFQVYSNTSTTPVVTPKSYGRALKPSELPEGIARFFAVADPDPAPAAAAAATPLLSPPTHSPAEGGDDNNNDNAAAAAAPVGLPHTTLAPLLRMVHREVVALRAVLAFVEARFVGASLLIVYEGDWARAEAVVRTLEKARARAEKRRGGGGGGDRMDRDDDEEDDEDGEDDDEDDEDDDEDDEDEDGDDEDDDEDDEDEDDDEDDEDEDGDNKEDGVPFVVKMIDFAHSRATPGAGPDEGVLLGLNTVLRLLAKRIEEVGDRGDAPPTT